MQTEELIAAIQDSRTDTPHQQQVTSAFKQLALDLETNLPEGIFKERALEAVQEAWLYAKESARVDTEGSGR